MTVTSARMLGDKRTNDFKISLFCNFIAMRADNCIYMIDQNLLH